MNAPASPELMTHKELVVIGKAAFPRKLSLYAGYGIFSATLYAGGSRGKGELLAYAEGTLAETGLYDKCSIGVGHGHILQIGSARFYLSAEEAREVFTIYEPYGLRYVRRAMPL